LAVLTSPVAICTQSLGSANATISLTLRDTGQRLTPTVQVTKVTWLQ